MKAEVSIYVHLSYIDTADNATNEQPGPDLNVSLSLPMATILCHLLIHQQMIKATLRLLSCLCLLLTPVPSCVIFSSRLQEVNSMINKRLKDVLFTDQWSEVCMERLSPFGYVLVSNGFYHKHICTLS